MNEIQRLSAVELVARIKSKKFSSRELTDFFIERIEKVNPQLNAVVYDFFDRARAQADEADRALAQGTSVGRLHGLPFTIKECFDYEGSPSTLGVLARKNDRPPSNDAYVEALSREGGIVLAKTNVPQLLIFIEAVNRVYGRTNNPHNSNFTCGGSSGGEGAIIGAGASPVGIGSDIGGSVRFPAAFCGICSIKPTMWRTPDLTRYGDAMLEGPINSVTGVLGNFAEDLGLFLDIINAAAGSKEPLLDFRQIEVSKLRVGYFVSDGIFEPMPAVKRAVLESVERLRTAGADVVEFRPPPFELAEEIFFRILTVDGAKMFEDVLDGEKPLPPIRNQLMIAKASDKSRARAGKLAAILGQKSVARVVRYFGGRGEEFLNDWARRQDDYRVDFLKALDDQKIDAILGPVAPLPAFLHNSTDKIGLGGTYTLLYNLLGFPAGVARVATVKAEESVGRRAGLDLAQRSASKAESMSAGLPLSVQVAARPWREDIVLALIAELHLRVSDL